LINPFYSIVLRSFLILALFVIPLFVFHWSTEIEEILKRFKKLF